MLVLIAMDRVVANIGGALPRRRYERGGKVGCAKRNRPSHAMAGLLEISFGLPAYLRFLCTLAATFKRRAFRRMKPVASSWL